MVLLRCVSLLQQQQLRWLSTEEEEDLEYIGEGKLSLGFILSYLGLLIEQRGAIS